MSSYHNIIDDKNQIHIEQIYKTLTDTEMAHFNMIYCLVSNLFTISLPDTGTPPRIINEMLIMSHEIAICDGGTTVGRCAPAGKILPSGLYDTYTIILPNGESHIRSLEYIELCRLNSIGIPFIYYIVTLSKELSNAYLSTKNATERSMLPPLLIAEDDSQVSSILDMYNKNLNFSPFRITKNDSFSNGEIQKVDLFSSNEYNLNMFWDNYTRLKNLIFNMFGVNSVDIQKRERLTTAEAETSAESGAHLFYAEIKRNLLDFNKRCAGRGWKCELSLSGGVERINENID